jgi:hypothetical protein
MGDDRHLEAGGGVDRIGEPSDVLSFGGAAYGNGNSQSVRTITHRVLRGRDELTNTVVGGEATALYDERCLSGIFRPQVARRARLDTDVVGASGHDASERTRQVGKPALTHIAITDKMIDGASEQMARWVREQACEADFGSETHGDTSFVIAGFAIAGADPEETLTRKQTNIQYFDFFRFYINDEFLTCIFVIMRLFL